MSFFIHTEADLDHAIAQLIRIDPRFAAVAAIVGPREPATDQPRAGGVIERVALSPTRGAELADLSRNA